MKKLSFLCVAVMVTAALIFKAENSFSQVYQLENGDFEDWPGSATTEPTGWNSFPSASCELPWPISTFGCGTATETRHERSNDVRPGATGYSCKIYATSAFSVTANGALTSGLMHLASTTPDDDSNCNQTKTDDNDFNHRLNAKPDSIVFWAKVVNASNDDSACCHLYIHDNYDLKDPLPANPSGYQSHIVGGVPSYNFPNNGSQWRRHSAPIIYEGYGSNDPQFVLITFSTNATPGGGSANDALYIDDIEFIYNPIHHEFSATACGSFEWDGTTYTESNDYVKSYTVGPRDSIVTLHLTITEAPSREETVTVEQCGGTHTWYNEEYTESGTYYHTVPTTDPSVCDSLITLHLTINQPVANEINETACGSYTWNDSIYTESGNYTQTLTAANGCDSVVTLHLTITEAPNREVSETACDSYTWYEQEYTESGNYQHTVENAEGCDSLITLHLTINESVRYEFDTSANESFTWNNETYTTSGDYVQTLSTVNNCDSIVTLHLTITTTDINENEMSEINVYPVPAKDMLNIEGEGIKSVTICDIVGKEIAEYKNDGEATMNISVDNFKSGSYMLVIKDENGNIITRRIAIMK
jgi:hypothetical protein